MKFFVDTADIAEIRELATAGIVDGVTTNPYAHRKDRPPDQGRDHGDLPGDRGTSIGGSHRHRL